MPLVNCSECRARVSDRAAACPHCGNPIADAWSGPTEVRASSGVVDGVKLGCGMFIVLPILLALGFLAIVLIMGAP